ncbi:MAG TPA: protein kinase, partial [Kofleriaceae bacterium]|nr:protein kinase [Kofleriaceae bacterium]
MEYVEGRSLDAVLRDGPLDGADAIRIARELTAGLDAAHRAGVIHSDLKPGNVILRQGDEPRALLTDFGIARALGDSGDHPVAGTPPYMAPEQWAGAQVGVWTDVFALALVIYELFSGERLLGDGAPAPDGLEPRVRARLPAPLADAVTEALDLDPARRSPTVLPLARALAELAGESFLPPPRPDPGLRLAIAPLRDLGPAQDDHLGVGLAEELTRVLAAHRGLEVVASGAMGDPTADPRASGRTAGASAVVHGSVQRAGSQVRVTVELMEVATGTRLWGDRFQGTLADLFEFEETMARRICESLRVGWLALHKVRAAPADAIDLYMRARRQLRLHDKLGDEGGIALLDQCLERAPGFQPAVALRAIACAHAWFLPSAVADRDWGELARSAAARALEEAPALAESHIAAAIIAAQDARYRDSVRALDRALELAPTSADAHSYLGRLQAEAGKSDEALWHLERALELDPAIDALLYVTRHHALRGDMSRAPELWNARGSLRAPALHQLLRFAMWSGDVPAMRRCVEATEALARHDREAMLLILFGRYVLGEMEPAEIERLFVERVPAAGLGKRIRSNLHQAMAEGHAARGEMALCLAHLSAAAAEALLDVEWLTRCTLLDPVRETEDFRRVMAQVRARAEEVWR